MFGKTIAHFKMDVRFGYRFSVSKFLFSIFKVALFRILRIRIYSPIEQTQMRISNHLFKICAGEVKYGPFYGMKFARNSSWGASSRGTMLLGIYESELLSEIIRASDRRKYFVDIGAADGYYAVGVLVGNLFEKSFCFETSEEGRRIILENSELNGVSDKVSIFGTATSDFYNQLSSEVRTNALVLIDIEGGEFDLLSSDVLAAFSNSIIMIEIHDWMVSDGKLRLDELKRRCLNIFEIQELKTGARNPGSFSELIDLSDSERWIACSEGREKLQTWWVLTPLEHKNISPF